MNGLMNYGLLESFCCSQEVKETLQSLRRESPESILELGLRHLNRLLESAELSVSGAPKLIDPTGKFVQNVVRISWKKGYTQSKFHAVFTDHKVGLQKHKCRNPECDWQSSTTTSVRTSIHPDLIGNANKAKYSYREAESNLRS